MYTVYVLQDDSGKLYKGCTNDLSRRLSEHNRGKTITTRRMNGLKIIYTEEYAIFDQARKRELYLKTAAGRRYLKIKLNMGV
jgi:putative endonuclease